MARRFVKLSVRAYYDSIMIRKFSVLKKTIFIQLFYVLYGVTLTYSIRLQGVSDLIHNLEGMDPEVLNLFTFSNKPAYRNKEDASEIDIMDVDTSDILNCFSSLSYVCFQRKILVYLDSLNRVDRINLFGGYLSFVRVSQGLTPPITEQLLASRHITDENTLSTLLKEVFEDFVDTHILRITVPVINTRLDARSARGHCYDFNLGDNKDENGTSGKFLIFRYTAIILRLIFRTKRSANICITSGSYRKL